MTDPTPDPAVSDCLGNAGTPHALRWRGREHPVARPCPAVIGRLEGHVVRAALDALAEVREAYTPAEYAAEQEALRAAVRAKGYRPGGSLWNAEMAADGGVRGMLLMLWGCMAEGHADPNAAPPTYPDVVLMYHEAADEVLAAAEVCLPDFTRATAERRGLPPAAVAAEVARAVARVAGPTG